METTIQITIFVVINAKLLSLKAEIKFLKVSSFGNLEESYVDSRQMGIKINWLGNLKSSYICIYILFFIFFSSDSSTTNLEEDPLIREDICRAILNSSSFLEIHQNVASSKGIHGNAFTSENILKSILSKITKLYQQREIFTRQGKLYESLLLCSVWDFSSRSIEEYFISRQYRI